MRCGGFIVGVASVTQQATQRRVSNCNVLTAACCYYYYHHYCYYYYYCDYY